VNNAVTICQTQQVKNAWHHVDKAAEMLKLHGEWQFRAIIPGVNEQSEGHPKAGCA
jgi:hypothetical protein